jgi:hypothetical protein
MPERYDDRRNRERDREHRRDHDNHSGYGSMYDRGYDYAGSEEDHGRGRLSQAGPGHHDADWGREKQQRMFGGQQQHGGYGQDREWRGQDREPQWSRPGYEDRGHDRERSRFAGAHGQRAQDGYGRNTGGGYGSDMPRAETDVYGARGGGRIDEGGFGRDQSGRYERQDFGASGEGYGRNEPYRSDEGRRGPDDGYSRNEGWRDDGRDQSGGGMRRIGEQVRSFFDRHRGEHEGEHGNRFFGTGRDDDTGWNDRLSDARHEGAQYGHRREGLWGERERYDTRTGQPFSHDRSRWEDRSADRAPGDRDERDRWIDRRR